MEYLGLLTDPAAWVAFLTLTALELVLGIDNVIFISILVSRLPAERQAFARKLGLGLAMGMRIVLLALLSWIAGLTKTLFTVIGQDISGRDIILIAGGLFLLWKSTVEVHRTVAGEEERHEAGAAATFGAVITQIAIIDLVFSLDSIITAIGMVDELPIMIAAVIVSILLMMAFSGAIAKFLAEHPTLKMLALSFLFVIGVVLIADGFDFHVPKGYVYFAMAFALMVEMLNMEMRRRRKRK